MKDRESKDILRFVTSKWWVMQALAFVYLTLTTHYKLVAPGACLFICVFVTTPYSILRNKVDDIPDIDRKKTIVISCTLVFMTLLGMIAEVIWPDNTYVLIFRLFAMVCVIGWSVLYRKKI